MKNKSIPLEDYPEYQDTLFELMNKLLIESDRGAIIIGATHVEEHLKNYIIKVLPVKSNNYVKKLFDYPGSLSSFAAKIEHSYAFRLIPKEMYNSLNTLRNMRNKAAHKSTITPFQSPDSELNEIFSFAEGAKTMVHETSIKAMIKIKLTRAKESIIKEGESEEYANNLLRQIMKKKETMETLEKQLPKWKLVYGLSVICGLLKFYSDETTSALTNVNIWGSLNDKIIKETNTLTQTNASLWKSDKR